MGDIGSKIERVLVPRVKGRQSKFMYQVVFPDHGGVRKAFFMFARKTREALLKVPSSFA